MNKPSGSCVVSPSRTTERQSPSFRLRLLVCREIFALPNVAQVTATQANGASLIVGTLSEGSGDALFRGSLMPFDALMIDESFQADSSRYYAIAGLAPTHLLVEEQWAVKPILQLSRSLYIVGAAEEDPLQDAVGVLLRNHRDGTMMTSDPSADAWDRRAVPVARAFYPDLPFEAAVIAGVRKLRLLPATSTHRKTRLFDKILAIASSGAAGRILNYRPPRY